MLLVLRLNQFTKGRVGRGGLSVRPQPGLGPAVVGYVSALQQRKASEVMRSEANKLGLALIVEIFIEDQIKSLLFYDSAPLINFPFLDQSESCAFVNMASSFKSLESPQKNPFMTD